MALRALDGVLGMLTRSHVTEISQLHYCATVQLNIDKAASVFQSLTDVTRLRILRLFLGAREDLCLCDISTALGEPTYKVSRHLKALREAGLLDAEREGRWLYHRISADEATERSLFRFVESVLDSEGQLEQDQLRLKKIRHKRSQDRCRGAHRGGHA